MTSEENHEFFQRNDLVLLCMFVDRFRWWIMKKVKHLQAKISKKTLVTYFYNTLHECLHFSYSSLHETERELYDLI